MPPASCLAFLWHPHLWFYIIILSIIFVKFDDKIQSGVKISKDCQGSFGPLMSYFWGPSQLFKGPGFPFPLKGLITVLLLPQNLRVCQVISLRARKQVCGPLAILTPGCNQINWTEIENWIKEQRTQKLYWNAIRLLSSWI